MPGPHESEPGDQDEIILQPDGKSVRIAKKWVDEYVEFGMREINERLRKQRRFEELYPEEPHDQP